MSELHVKIGKLLKLERERLGIPLDDLSTRLKISACNLEHIETGNLDALPSELYFNLFAKSYAEALSIDYAGTIEAIKEDIGQPLEPQNAAQEEKRDDSKEADISPKLETAPPARKTSAETKFLRNSAILFVIVIVLALIFVLVSKLFNNADNGKPTKQELTDDGSGRSSAVKQPASGIEKFSRYDWNIPEYQKPSAIRLKLVAHQESWATVLADGDTVIFRTLVPWRVYEDSAKYNMQVSIAVPSAVDVELNDTPVDLRNPITRRISRVKINQVNLDSLLNLHKLASNRINKPESWNQANKSPDYER